MFAFLLLAVLVIASALLSLPFLQNVPDNVVTDDLDASLVATVEAEPVQLSVRAGDTVPGAVRGRPNSRQRRALRARGLIA